MLKLQLFLLCSGSERALVRGKDTVCLRKEVFVEGKKEQEPRVIVSDLLIFLIRALFRTALCCTYRT